MMGKEALVSRLFDLIVVDTLVSNPAEGPTWPQFTPATQVLLQLNSQNLTVIPGDYREDQIAFINISPSVFGH